MNCEYVPGWMCEALYSPAADWLRGHPVQSLIAGAIGGFMLAYWIAGWMGPLLTNLRQLAGWAGPLLTNLRRRPAR